MEREAELNVSSREETSMQHDWRDVLLKVASEVSGAWFQGEFYDRSGFVDQEFLSLGIGTGERCLAARNQGAGLCAMGHIYAVAEELAISPQEAYTKLSNAVGSIPSWNDDPNQTTANVAATMREVASSF